MRELHVDRNGEGPLTIVGGRRYIGGWFRVAPGECDGSGVRVDVRGLRYAASEILCSPHLRHALNGRSQRERAKRWPAAHCPRFTPRLNPRPGETSMTNAPVRGVGHTALCHDPGVYLIVRRRLEVASRIWAERGR